MDGVYGAERTTMRRSERAFSVAFVAVVAMFASGCAPSGPQRSCRTNDFLECVDYVEGFTDEGAIFLCDASTSTYSGSSSCPGGRAAHCTYVTDGFITGTVEGTSVCYCIDAKTWVKVRTAFNAMFDKYKPIDSSCC